MLRSVSARWFELMVPRESVARALEALAATGRVELEPNSADEEDLIPIPQVDLELAKLAALERRYQAWWPPPATIRMRRNWLLERELKAAMRQVEQWVEAAEPHVQRIERLRRELGELVRLEQLCLAAHGDHDLDFSDLAAPDSSHTARVFILPAESETPPSVEALLTRRLDSHDATWLIVFGRRERVANLAEQLEGQRARTLELPRWLAGNPGQARVRVLKRRAAAERLEHRNQIRIEQLNEQFQLARALGHLRRVAWLAEHLEGITTSEYMAHLRGWTCDNDSDAIAAALDQAGIPCAVALPPAPGSRMAPSISVNPRWAKPFELFAGLVGTPGRNEADPSMLVALIAPMLFGYMFGDVGHGAVLIATGLLLRKRFPGTALMIWGGSWAMLFGLMFGAVFAREDLVPALWLHPIVNPLPVLMVPLGVGAVLLLLSMLLNGLEHAWADRFTEWLLTQSGIALALVVAVAAIVEPGLWPLVAAVLALQYLGIAFENRGLGPIAFIGALGELLEALMQLIVNTLSFIRVGAFALAHAGLSLAVISLADSTTSLITCGLIMVIGNALIIAIEGLVASIQTTRLVLFEFFNRFLTAGGRAFQPLLPPLDASIQPLVPTRKTEEIPA